jgi:hypothetical protein
MMLLKLNEFLYEKRRSMAISAFQRRFTYPDARDPGTPNGDV